MAFHHIYAAYVREHFKAAVDYDEASYTVATTGATMRASVAKAAVHEYCQRLWGDGYCEKKPLFRLSGQAGSLRCSLLMPSSTPREARVAVSPVCESETEAVNLCALGRVLFTNFLNLDNTFHLTF